MNAVPRLLTVICLVATCSACTSGAFGDASLATGGVSGGAAPGASQMPSPTEIAYAGQTARMIFRSKDVERSAGFATIDTDGYGLCLRAPGKGPALLVFSQRLMDDAVSQVDDASEIRRRPADTIPCQGGGVAWIRA